MSSENITMNTSPAHTPAHTQRGAALIEVLVAVIVLAVALAALAKFQGSLIQFSGTSKARAVAAHLAQEKFDDLRSFTQLSSGGNGTYGYAEIGTNTGGTEKNDGTLNVAAYAGGTKLTVSNEEFNRTWTVENLYICNKETAPKTTNCTGSNEDAAHAWPNYKRVTITVSWVDKDGTQSLVQTGVINSTNPVTDVLSTSGVSQNDKPLVTYNPGAAPDVIAIEVDPTKKKETSKPEPETTQHEDSTEVRFDVVNYLSSTLKTLKREGFTTINCICTQDGTGDALTPAADEDDDGHLDEGTGVVVTKRKGLVDESGNIDAQPPACDICCRDHHDANGGSNTTDDDEYDPFRPNDNANYPPGIGGDHAHFNRDNSGNLVAADGNNDQYIEACRFRRIDGFLRMVRDWRLEKVTVTPSSFLSSNGGDYDDYVEAFVGEYITTAAGITNYTQNPPDVSTFTATLANKPASISMDTTLSDDTQLSARAIYIDYMTDAKLDELANKIQNGEDFLDETPFYEVNITRLANWVTDTPAVAAVTSEAIQSGTEETYSRGFVTDVAAGTAIVTATIEPSNTGLTDSSTVDSDDEDSSGFIADDITVNVTGGAPPPPPPPANKTITGSLSFVTTPNSEKPTGGLQISDISIVGSNGATCELSCTNSTTLQCGNNEPCIVAFSRDASGNGTITVNGYGSNKVCIDVSGDGQGWFTTNTYTASGSDPDSIVVLIQIRKNTSSCP
jgi:Tfp pilus assembly protein PilV